jgi:hypothetical protein
MPFVADRLDPVPLPGGAVWHHEGWDGAVLPYARIQGDPDGAATVLAFAKAVFDAGAATLRN